jgi:hypothetical protein
MLLILLLTVEIESSLAKVRLFRVSEFLGAALAASVVARISGLLKFQ